MATSVSNGDRWRGDEGRDLGSILRAYADRVDRFRLAVVEDCRRKVPIHSSARIDVATVVAHVRHRLLRIKIDRRRKMAVLILARGHSAASTFGLPALP